MYAARLNVLRLQRRAREAQEERAKLVEVRGDACTHVEDLVGNVAFESQQVGPRRVLHKHEVHGLAAVAEDARPLTLVNGVQPAHKDFGVNPFQVHAQAVDVENSEGPHREA